MEPGEDKILALKVQLCDAPTLANLRSQLDTIKVIPFPMELAIQQTDLSFYDQKYGVSFNGRTGSGAY